MDFSYEQGILHAIVKLYDLLDSYNTVEAIPKEAIRQLIEEL